MNRLDRGAHAAQLTLDRFGGKPFKFGRRDCAQMVRFHLLAMGKPINVAKAGTYHSALGAARAIKRLGYGSLMDLMDANFERVTPASAWVGDVLAFPGVEGDALAVRLSNGRCVGYHEDAVGACTLEPHLMIAAWRVP